MKLPEKHLPAPALVELLAPDVAVIFDAGSDEAVFAFSHDEQLVTGRCNAAFLRTTLAAALATDSTDPASSAIITQASQFFTCAEFFTEETSRIAMLPETLADLSGDDLLLVLADAARTNAKGYDSQPLFPEAARDEAHTWDAATTLSGIVTITSAAINAIESVAVKIAAEALGFNVNEMAAAEQEISLDFRCETLVRAALRAHQYNASLADGDSEEEADSTGEGDKATTSEPVTALIAITAHGASIGLWSPARGLFVEAGEPFLAPDTEWDANIFAASLAHALHNFALYLSPAQLQNYDVPGCEKLIWATSPLARHAVADQMKGFAADLPFPCVEAAAPLEELAAEGLLLANNTNASGLVAAIDLADSAPLRARRIAEARTASTRATASATKHRVKLAVLAPFVLACGIIAGGYIDALRTTRALDAQILAEETEKARLAPVAARRSLAIEALKWTSAYLDQITDLRRRQPASLSLLAELDGRYPLASDNTFTVKTLNAKSDGTIEIQCLAKRDEALTAFITSLEFSPQLASGKKLFEHPVYELRRAEIGAAGSGGMMSQLPGQGSLPVAAATRPDVNAWTVRAVYTPLQRDSPVAAAAAAPPAAAVPATPPPSPVQK